MRAIKLVLVVACLIVTVMTHKAFSQAKNDDNDEITKGFKIYEETMGGDEGWTLAKDKKGIKVHHRKVDITPINVLKGTAELETDLTTLLAFLTDLHNFPSWIVMCNSVEVFKSTGDDADEIDQVVYSGRVVNRPPWPVKPRDNVIYAILTQDPETLTLRAKGISLPDSIPHKEGFVRCPLLLMEFRLRPLDNGNTEFIFETVVDVGGWIPDWVINVFSVRIPYMTIQNIRKNMPFEEKYTQKRFKWLKVPPSHMKVRNVVMEKKE
jgi:hypothetical protein